MISHSMFVALVSRLDILKAVIEHLTPIELLILFIIMVVYWASIAMVYVIFALIPIMVLLPIYAWLEDELPRLMRPPKVANPRRTMDELSDSYVRSVAQLLLRR